MNTIERSLADAVAETPLLNLRAGKGDHRFLPIWMVVVDGRVYARSYSGSGAGWQATFRHDPRGTVEAEGQTFPVRAAFEGDDRDLNDRIDAAYRAKYRTAEDLLYIDAMVAPEARATTVRLTAA